MRTAPAARPVHLRWQHLALVFAGGTVGTALRELLAISVPPVAGVAVVIVGINVVGAFLLGLLLETLARRGPDDGRRRQLRLLLGTGVLGGFTTYSAFNSETLGYFLDGAPGRGALYLAATVLGCGAAGAAGWLLAGALVRA